MTQILEKAFKNEIEENDALTRELCANRQVVNDLKLNVSHLRSEIQRLRLVIVVGSVLVAFVHYV